jgi:hypothetical protein
MAELDLRSSRNAGYPFESPNIALEIFRLATAIAASETLAELAKDELDGLKWEWLRLAEFPEICRILVSIAAITRSNIDSNPSSQAADAHLIAKPVGTLRPDLDNPHKTEPLEFREACNKILHANYINPDVSDIAQGMKSPLKPRLYLYGKHRGKEWRATVEIFAFAIAATQLC